MTDTTLSLAHEITTSLAYPIIVIGDTISFTRFYLRNLDSKEHIGQYLIDLYNEIIDYQVQTRGHVKFEADGFFAIHETKGQEDLETAVLVLEACERLQKKIEEKIKASRFAKPEGFRIRIAGGRSSMDLRLILRGIVNCANNACEARKVQDTVGYSGLLASRMQDVFKKIPLICDEFTYELVKKDTPFFRWKKVPPVRRIPEGIFKEDLQTLWQFQRRST